MDNNTFTLMVTDLNGVILAKSAAAPAPVLTFEREYQPGDRLLVYSSRWPIAMKLSLDEHLSPALVWLTADRYDYPVPLKAAADAYPPEAFKGTTHTLRVSAAHPEEWNNRRNLAVNSLDRRGDSACYPHCVANIETRDESAFAARNSIDGVTQSAGHGGWPYQSWGIGEHKQPELFLRFGRRVRVDEAVIWLRADFPHDSYWREVTLLFSDGSQLPVCLEKTAAAQPVKFSPKVIEWVKLLSPIRAEDETSPFPALTEWEFYGTDAE